jgi:hypothetical protein
VLRLPAATAISSKSYELRFCSGDSPELTPTILVSGDLLFCRWGCDWFASEADEVGATEEPVELELTLEVPQSDAPSCAVRYELFRGLAVIRDLICSTSRRSQPDNSL